MVRAWKPKKRPSPPEVVKGIVARGVRTDSEKMLNSWHIQDQERRKAERRLAALRADLQTADEAVAIATASSAIWTRQFESAASEYKRISAGRDHRPEDNNQLAMKEMRRCEAEKKNAAAILAEEEQKVKRVSAELQQAEERLAKTLETTAETGLYSLTQSSISFIKHLVGASGVLATLCAGTLALAATTRNGTGLTTSLTWAMILALGGIVLGITFHGIPFFSHLGDWFRHGFRDIQHDSISKAFLRERHVQVAQLVLVFVQLILWSVAIGLLMGNLIGGGAADLEAQVPSGGP